MKRQHQRKRKRPAGPVAVWKVLLNDGDWYSVFAQSSNGAIKQVIEHHYDDMTRGEFQATYRPIVRRLRDNEILGVRTENNDNEEKTAKEWCEGETVGLFCSNTYEL